MKERIYSYKVTVTCEDLEEKIHFLMQKDKTLSVDYDSYDTAEEALECFLHFMQDVYQKKYPNAIAMHYDLKPYIYEIVNENNSILAYRMESPKRLSDYAIILLDKFKEITLNDIVIFLKEYCQSDCLKDFSCVVFIPSEKSRVSVMDAIYFPKSDVINSTLEELKEKFLNTKLIGYMYL